MAKTSSPLTILPEPYGQERPATNIETEEALQTLLEALEARRNRGYDPRMLALAEGFLSPTKTGSGFEAIGRAAGKFREADIEERQEDVEFAQQRLGLISQMAEVERRKQRDKMFGSGLGIEPQVGQQPESQGQLVRGSEAFAPPGVGSMPGIQLAPPNPNIQTGRSYLKSAYLEGKEDYSAALKAAQEIERKRYEVRENGIFDLATGLFFPTPKGEPVERQIKGFDGTFKIPASQAYMLDFYDSVGDTEKYDELARRILGADRKTKRSPAGDETADAALSPGAPRIKSEREKMVEGEKAKVTATEEAKRDVEMEGALNTNDDSARIMFQNAEFLQDLARKSPRVFGLLQTPTVASAIGTLIDEGISVGNTRISLGGFQDALMKSMPGITQEDIKNLELAASALAELELKYTQLYLKGQGQVTEGERLIVRKIAGTPKNSAEFITTKAKLIQMRSQYDIDVIDTFRRIKEANPNITWTQFERSKTFRDLRNDYNKSIAESFDVKSAVPSRERGAAGSKDSTQKPSSGINTGNDMTSDRLTGTELQRKIDALKDHPNKAALEARLRDAEQRFKERLASEKNPIKITSQEEFNRLEPGTIYQLPNGTKGIKGERSQPPATGTGSKDPFSVENFNAELKKRGP